MIFLGTPQDPFLAPRHVFITKTKLIICDTGNNRVLIWNSIPSTEYGEPDIILGDTKKSNQTSSTTLYYPTCSWTNGHKLLIADAWNHRVLVWNTFPQDHYTPADVVIGQQNFDSNAINADAKKTNAEPTANSLYWPYGLESDGRRIWIADTGNRRVLEYQNYPQANYSSADRVLGQPNFYSRDMNPNHAVWPYSICVHNNHLAIADTQYYRVLLWKNLHEAFTGKGADHLIGQTDFEQNGQNQYRLVPEPNTLNWVYDVAFYKSGLLIADTGNSRIVRFKALPHEHNQSADSVIGQPNLNTIGDSIAATMGDRDFLYWPFSVCTADKQIAIADTGNNRIWLL